MAGIQQRILAGAGCPSCAPAFHITSGFQEEDIPNIKYKSKMKAFYQKVGIPVARYHMADTLEGCLSFAEKVGYPIVAKPDNGVGASHTFKIENDQQMGRILHWQTSPGHSLHYGRIHFR